MRKGNVLTIAFPAIPMAVMMVLMLLNWTEIQGVDLKGLMVISLVVLFPLLIFIQGLITYRHKTNIIFSLGTSLLGIILFIMVLTRHDTRTTFETCVYYCGLYFVFGVVGYVVGFILKKVKSLTAKS
ncbi:MAG TPA: hypothetical protein DCY20_06475 [Firmicutes bacterium]|nr:hypothetical protein [Bacillota bacterium]